ncbi:MAG: Ig-like domain-containing protein, partial [Fibrobacterota bacterium]
ADTSAPSVALTSPAANATVSGSVTVTASASDNVAVTGVQFKLDGANLGSEITSAPFSAALNTTTLSNGSHTLSAVARDAAGNLASATTITVNVSNTTTTTPPTTTTPTTTTPTTATGVTVWFDDALPANAGASASGGDGWNWVTASPAPFSGTKAHQSNIVAGLHEHAFNWAAPLAVAAGDILVTHVYLDPANLPSQIMLSFAADNWEHRAYWGANQISNGTNGTASRFRVGDRPAAGQWVRLEGKSVQGMSFSLYNGRATFDLTGKAAASSTTTPTTDTSTTPPTTDTSTTQTVTVAATDANALIGSATDTAMLTFTRTGSTAASLVVNYTISGSAVKWIDYRRVQGDMPVNVTIPAGAASTTMTILAISNVTNANPATAIFTLAND